MGARATVGWGSRVRARVRARVRVRVRVRERERKRVEERKGGGKGCSNHKVERIRVLKKLFSYLCDLYF